jgi:hypothetical protein
LDMSGEDSDEGVEQMDEGAGVGLGTIPPPPPTYVKIRTRNNVKEMSLGNNWHHRRPPARRTAGPNVYTRLELSGSRGTRNSQRA